MSRTALLICRPWGDGKWRGKSERKYIGRKILSHAPVGSFRTLIALTPVVINAVKIVEVKG